MWTVDMNELNATTNVPGLSADEIREISAEMAHYENKTAVSIESEIGIAA